MILECGKCAKMYRVRDDASSQPTQCPTCGGELRATGGGAPSSAAGRVKELETRIQNLERELEESRSSRPTLSVETSPGFSGFGSPVAELRSTAEKADRLERELLSLRSEMERQLKDKDREVAAAREAADREGAERRKHEARASGLEETHGRSVEGKDRTIQALDASIATYRAKVETLQKKLDAVEMQRLNDLNTFDARVREREHSDRAALDKATGAQQKALSDLRSEMEKEISEKDQLITEGRQALDREAGERRRLSETLHRLQENADRAVVEKETALAALDATLASYKSKIETLQKRVDSLEQLRRTEHDQMTRQLSSRQSIRSRVDEAGLLADDLDHSLDSIEASIASIRDRARRLKSTLQESGEEAEAPPAFSSLAPAPEPEVEAEPARPTFSQADVWSEPAPIAEPEPEPAPAVEPEPEPEAELEAPAAEVVEPEPEPPVFSPVTSTIVKQTPEEDPLPDLIETEKSPESSLLDSVPIGRFDEPSQILPVVPSPSPEVADDIPLISPPEDEAAAPPSPEKPGDPQRKRFSWQRK